MVPLKAVVSFLVLSMLGFGVSAQEIRTEIVHREGKNLRIERAGADRIRERRGPIVALMRTPTRLLVVRMPGPDGKVWYLKV